MLSHEHIEQFDIEETPDTTLLSLLNIVNILKLFRWRMTFLASITGFTIDRQIFKRQTDGWIDR